MHQKPLALVGGHHAGPLFVPVKRRAPKLQGFNGSRRINGMVRRASERRATPPGTDLGLVRHFYKLARIYTEATGVRYSVEHMVPLTHPIVSGLHVPANLEVLPLDENVRKGNRWWPDMPEQQAVLL